MNCWNSRSRLATVLVLMLILTTSAAAEEQAVEVLDGQVILHDLPEAVGDSLLVLTFADYQPTLPVEADCLRDPVLGLIQGQSNCDTCCLVAPVRLPDDVVINSFVVYFQKTSSSNFRLDLLRKELGTLISAAGVMATVDSSGFPGSSVVRIGIDASVLVPAVDNTRYSYYLSTDTCMDNETTSILSASINFN